MSDQPAHPPSPPQGNSEAKPSAPGPKIALPKQQTPSISQHIFIWALVVIVGVLFGMGGTVNFLKSPVRSFGKIEESEILLRSNTAHKLQDMINPMRFSRTQDGSDMFEKRDSQQTGMTAFEQWAREIQEARVAEAQGLLPAGAALQAIKEAFLKHPLPDGSGKTYADAMREHSGGDKEVSGEELDRFLAERTAVELLFARNIIAPALPLPLADDVASYRGDKVQADELVLTAKHLLPKIADNDAEIQSTYDKLRNTRFGRPRVAIVSVAYADAKALADKATVSEAEVETYYNAHKEQYKKPAKPAEPPKPAEAAKPAKPGDAAKPAAPPAKVEPEYKTVAEVAEEIRTALKKKAAETKAHELIQAFNDAANDLENLKDNVAFKAAAAKAGLLVKEGVAIEEPISGNQLKVPGFGELNESQLRLFAQDLNYIFSPIQSTGETPTWVLLRLDDKHEAGFRDLKEPAVRSEVIAALAGQRAYKDLLKEAEIARAAAEKLGPGGLKAYAKSPAAKAWGATVTSAPQAATTELRAPPAEIDSQISGTPTMIASLAVTAAPVMLAQAGSDSAPGAEDVPKVRLVQVTGYTPAPAPSAEDRTQDLEVLHNVVEGYRRTLYYTNELRNQMGR